MLLSHHLRLSYLCHITCLMLTHVISCLMLIYVISCLIIFYVISSNTHHQLPRTG